MDQNRKPGPLDGIMSNARDAEATLRLSDNESEESAELRSRDDAEARMRQALGLFGSRARHEGASDASQSGERRNGGGGGGGGNHMQAGARRHRFVQDGEVPVSVVRGGRREPAQGAGVRLGGSEGARFHDDDVATERSAREQVERRLAEAQAVIHSLQTRLGLAELARDEAVEAVAELRETVAAAEAARMAETAAEAGRDAETAADAARMGQTARANQPTRHARVREVRIEDGRVRDHDVETEAHGKQADRASSAAPASDRAAWGTDMTDGARDGTRDGAGADDVDDERHEAVADHSGLRDGRSRTAALRRAPSDTQKRSAPDKTTEPELALSEPEPVKWWL